MPIILDWRAIILRLTLTAFAAAVIGIDRGEHGRPAGLRTTLLVGLAAAVSMIQANLLLNTTGRAHDSFVVLDLMRLPLGILSGMGFIGAGAILRKDNLVLGVTTAATLWFVTVMGLCFGGGQIGLGLAALTLGFAVLSGLRWVDQRMPQDRHATLNLKMTDSGPEQPVIQKRLEAAGLKITSYSLCHLVAEKVRDFKIGVHWRAPAAEPKLPVVLVELAQYPGVLIVEWKP